MNAQIAQHLNISEKSIKSVEVWASVLFVQFVSGRPRFVSKKVVENQMIITWMAGNVESKAELITDAPQQYSGADFYRIFAKDDRKVVGGKIEMHWRFVQNVRKAELDLALNEMPAGSYKVAA